MKVKDLLRMKICVDVYDNVCEELGIAFDGAMSLTDEGKEHFAEALEYEVELHENPFLGNVAIVDVDGDDWRHKLNKAKELFESMAGWCSVKDYAKWFIEE